MEMAKEAMKRQFDKKRQNPQGLKERDNIWLEAKKRYRPFKISKNIGQGAFQLELLEGWMIHNVFNEDLLI